MFNQFLYFILLSSPNRDMNNQPLFSIRLLNNGMRGTSPILFIECFNETSDY